MATSDLEKILIKALTNSNVERVDLGSGDVFEAFGYSSSMLNSEIKHQKRAEILEEIQTGKIIVCQGSPYLSLLCFDNEYGEIVSGCFLSSCRGYYTFIASENIIDPFEILSSLIDEDKNLLLELAQNTEEHYHQFPRPKRSGGQRWINAPNADLKRVQKKIKKEIINHLFVTPFAHGFRMKKSVVTNAKGHVGKKVVINMDISNFFDNITIDKVKGIIFNNKHIQPLVKPVSLLTTVPKGETRVTPQGAPTSPYISNAVLSHMDFSISGVCKRFNAFYTRYADDLTISGNDSDLQKIIPIIMKVVNEYGFWINKKKTNVFRRGGRQIVTGLVVNDKLNVARKKRMRFRAHLHHIRTGQIPLGEVNYPEIRGFAEYIRMANPEQGERFVQQCEEIRQMLNGECEF